MLVVANRTHGVTLTGMKTFTGSNSVIPVWCIVAILLAACTALPVQAAVRIRAMVVPRHPTPNAWVALVIYGLPAFRNSRELQLRDARGGPISEVTITSSRPALVPLAYISPVSRRHWALQYRMARRAEKFGPWRPLRVTVHRRRSWRRVKTYLLMAPRPTAAVIHSGSDEFLSISAGTLLHAPPMAIAAFNGCIITGTPAHRIRRRLIRRLLPTGITIYQFTPFTPHPGAGIPWQKAKLHFDHRRDGWKLATPAPPIITPIVASLRRLRLPPPVPPALWGRAAVVCGFAAPIVLILVWIIAGRSTALVRISALLIAGLLTGFAGVAWLNQAPGVDTVEYHWRQRARASAEYQLRWQIDRALVNTRLVVREASAIPVAWDERSWHHLHAWVHFAQRADRPNQIVINMPKGTAVVIQSRHFRFNRHPKSAPQHWVYFSDGRLRYRSTGPTLGVDAWIARQREGTRPSIKAWLIYGRRGCSHWRLTTHPYFEVQPLVPPASRATDHLKRTRTAGLSGFRWRPVRSR